MARRHSTTHSKDVDAHLESMKKLLHWCVTYNFKLHPSNCTLFTKTIRRCGRQISKDGIKFYPRRIEGIRQVQHPLTGDDLQQCFCAMQWMGSIIRLFSTIISPISSFLEKVYRRAGKRTRLAVANVSLVSFGWGAAEDISFHNCNDALENQGILAGRDESKRLCVYTFFNWSTFRPFLFPLLLNSNGRQLRNFHPFKILQNNTVEKT